MLTSMLALWVIGYFLDPSDLDQTVQSDSRMTLQFMKNRRIVNELIQLLARRGSRNVNTLAGVKLIHFNPNCRTVVVVRSSPWC